MKKFGGVRQLDDLRKRAIKAGWKVDEKAYHEEHSDYIFLYEKTDDNVVVAVNTFNGQFFVYDNATDKNIATHLSSELDNKPWYAEILDIFNKPQENSGQRAF